MCFGALARARGSVVCVSSVSGGTIDSTGAPYHMTKAAMEHMTRCAAGPCERGSACRGGQTGNPQPQPEQYERPSGAGLGLRAGG
eukprot:scaffold8666_cov73-Isochrysis_galbana.AAC.1